MLNLEDSLGPSHSQTMLASVAILLALTSSAWQQGTQTKLAASLGVPFEVQKNWAESSPWFPLTEYTKPPDGCEITQVSASIFGIDSIRSLPNDEPGQYRES